MAEDQTASGSSGNTNELLRKMMKQATRLNEKVDTIEKRSEDPTRSRGDSEEETEEDSGGLVQLTKTTKTFLEAAFSWTLSNVDRKKGVDKVGVPDCDQIRCPNLDGVLKTVLPKDTIKADGYLSHLHQFWLDAIAPLAAIIESAEGGGFDTREGGGSCSDSVVFDGQRSPANGAREVQGSDFKVEPILEVFMVEEQKNFNKRSN